MTGKGRKIEGIKAYDANVDRGVLLSSDDEDLMSDYLWHTIADGALRTNNIVRDGKAQSTRLARVVWERMNGDMNLKVIHKDGNKFNCRRENLQGISHGEVTVRRQKIKSNTRLRNVYRNPGNGLYYVHFTRDKVKHYVGHYKTTEEAQKALEEALIKYEVSKLST